jgi:hypothetical protein
MISFAKPRRVTSTAAMLFGAVLLASPVLAAPSSSSSPQAKPSPAGQQIVMSSSSSSSRMTEPNQESPGPEAVEARIKELHSKLHITAAQDKQWNDLAEVMRDNARAMVAVEKKRSIEAQSMNAVDVVKSYETVIEAHEEGMKHFIPAFETLYDSMSDSQKKAADSMFRVRAKQSAKQTAER